MLQATKHSGCIPYHVVIHLQCLSQCGVLTMERASLSPGHVWRTCSMLGDALYLHSYMGVPLAQTCVLHLPECLFAGVPVVEH